MPVAPVPAYGGQVLLVGPIAPEVRVDSDGSVHAYLPEDSARLPSGKVLVAGGQSGAGATAALSAFDYLIRTPVPAKEAVAAG